MEPSEMRTLLAQLGVRPSKEMGQNFLLSDRVLLRSVKEAEVGPDDTVLEIGGGVGNLTRHLAATGAKVVTVEPDQLLAFHLETTMPENVRVIEGDFLELSPEDAGPITKVVANVPYNISSPLIFRLQEYDFAKGVLMLQYEFAQRLTAPHGNKTYGRITAAVARTCGTRMLGKVKRGNFYPVPRVDSAMVLLEPQGERFPVGDPAFFDAMLRVLFSQRRKMIRNALGGGFCYLGESCGVDDKEVWAERIPEEWRTMRAEQLSPEELGRLAMALQGSVANSPDR